MKQDAERTAQRETGRRRRFTQEFRRQVVQETLAPGVSVAGVALQHRLNANQVFTWRRKLLPALAPARAKSVKLLPVTLSESPVVVPAVAAGPGAASQPRRRCRARGAIEVEFNGARLVLTGAVDRQVLRVVLAALVSR
ncbi:MAG: transposase [Betaproteobacteria bacterium]|nr:transposase [Betaproteobacteria bacterium]